MYNPLFGQKVKTEANTFILTVIILGIFGGLAGLFLLGGVTFIRIDTVFNMVIISGAVAFLLHAPFLKKMNRYLVEVIAYCLVGWGLLLSALLLGLNYEFHAQVEVNTYYINTAIAHPEDRELPYPITVTLSKQGIERASVSANEYDDFAYLLKFEGADELKCNDHPVSAVITTAKGLFGYRVLLHKELH